MHKYQILIEYVGTNFIGWQIQSKGKSIQKLIQIKLSKLLKEKVNLIGSGRTDAGVHALGQVAHIDLDVNLHSDDIKNAINANLPYYCRIMQVEEVHEFFHSRFNAKRRFYRYQCYTGESILYRNQAWLIKSIDVVLLNRLSKKILGENDFLSFSKYNKDNKNTKCFIFNCNWSSEEKMVTFHIEANRYLHHMIRYLVGTMIAVYQKIITEDHFFKLFENPKKNVKIYKAPPQGLILEKVMYD